MYIMKNFLKGLLIRLTGLLLIPVGVALSIISLVIGGILFLIIASIVYLFMGVNWFGFGYYLFYPLILLFYGAALLTKNEWFTIKEFMENEFREKDKTDYE